MKDAGTSVADTQDLAVFCAKKPPASKMMQQVEKSIWFLFYGAAESVAFVCSEVPAAVAAMVTIKPSILLPEMV